MNYLQRLEHLSDLHYPRWMDIIRIALGVFLCFKGVEFAQNTGKLMGLMTNQVPFSSFMLILVSHYILFAHILGGFLLAIGMLTRRAALIQIPVLLGAIIFVNTSPAMVREFSELTLSIIVLLLLIWFLIIGGGQWSFDYAMDRDKNK